MISLSIFGSEENLLDYRTNDILKYINVNWGERRGGGKHGTKQLRLWIQSDKEIWSHYWTEKWQMTYLQLIASQANQSTIKVRKNSSLSVWRNTTETSHFPCLAATWEGSFGGWAKGQVLYTTAMTRPGFGHTQLKSSGLGNSISLTSVWFGWSPDMAKKGRMAQPIPQ